MKVEFFTKQVVTNINKDINKKSELLTYKLKEKIQEEIRVKNLVKSGNLLNSVEVENNENIHSVFMDIDKAPYAAVVEFGYVGTDALGRVYNKKEDPYFRPAIAKAIRDISKLLGND